VCYVFHLCSKIVSLMVSFFSSTYVMKWHKFFPHKELQYPPSFDGRVVCYPSTSILRDYLAWRQVDCELFKQFCYSTMSVNRCVCFVAANNSCQLKKQLQSCHYVK
jgi:tRNA(His) 5'-end guanylyltransferase